MTDLDIPATQSSPLVKTSSANGTIEMRGDSYPENSFEFFTPVISWVREYLDSSKALLRLDLHLLYLNTSSVKVMMDIFDMLEEAHATGREVRACWFYDAENERIAELAEEFKEDCSFDFQIIQTEA
ncbi:MAG TPA: biofilm regulation phosphoprotein SiaC [Abditibacteriaceae bacterium]|jgi:hypothetical protein